VIGAAARQAGLLVSGKHFKPDQGQTMTKHFLMWFTIQCVNS
jgi:hypothetical protein